MTAVILPSEVEYQPFTDDQIASFAEEAKFEYANPDQYWRADLDDAAKELLIEYASNDWPTPSSLRKRLFAANNNPDEFIQRLANEAEFRESPEATAILHGTRWRPDQLARAGEYRDQFITGVKREIEWGNLIINRRKDSRITGHSGDAAMDRFIDQLAGIYQDAFCKAVNVGLSGSGSDVDGPFIRFSKKVLTTLKMNLPSALQDNEVSSKLGQLAMSGKAIYKRLGRSGNYEATLPA